MTNTLPTLTYEQNQAFAAFLEQSGLTEKSLYTALEQVKREEERVAAAAIYEEKAANYGGKCYAVENGGTTMYYKVVAPYGCTYSQVSCIRFGLNPELEESYDYLGKVNEILLGEDTDFFIGSEEISNFVGGKEISEEEFAVAFRDWTERVLKLRWDV